METIEQCQPEELELLNQMISEIRSQFMQMLESAVKGRQTKGSCGFACYYAKGVLEHFTHFKVIIRGGDGRHDGGYEDIDGKRHGHYWMEVIGKHERYIVDYTADQFGDSPIVILPVKQAYRYFNGCQETVDQHLAELIEG